MSYASHADVLGRVGTAAYVQLTDDLGNGTADEEVVSAALAEAEAEVDSFLARRFRVPVSTADPQVAALLRGVTLDLAAYRLHARRPPAPEEVRRMRDAAMEWLRQVAAGEVTLPTTVEVEGSRSAVTLGAERMFTAEEMENL